MAILPEIVDFLIEECRRNPPTKQAYPYNTKNGPQEGWIVASEAKNQRQPTAFCLYTVFLTNGRLVQSCLYSNEQSSRIVYQDIVGPGSVPMAVIGGFYELIDELAFNLPETLGVPRSSFYREFPDFKPPQVEKEEYQQLKIDRLIDSIFVEVRRAYRAGYRGCNIRYPRRKEPVRICCLAEQLADELRIKPFDSYDSTLNGIRLEFAERGTREGFKTVGPRDILGALAYTLLGRR